MLTTLIRHPLRTLLAGLLIVSALFVVNMARQGTWGSDVGQRQGSGFAEPERAQYPSQNERTRNRKQRKIVFVVVQSGATRALTVTTFIDNAPLSRVVTEGRWSQVQNGVFSGSLLKLTASPRFDQDYGQGKLQCTIMIDGVVYEDHLRGRYRPYMVGNECTATAVVP